MNIDINVFTILVRASCLASSESCDQSRVFFSGCFLEFLNACKLDVFIETQDVRLRMESRRPTIEPHLDSFVLEPRNETLSSLIFLLLTEFVCA